MQDSHLSASKIIAVKLYPLSNFNSQPSVINDPLRYDFDCSFQIFFEILPLLHEFYRHRAELPSLILKASHTLACLAKVFKVEHIQ